MGVTQSERGGAKPNRGSMTVAKAQTHPQQGLGPKLSFPGPCWTGATRRTQHTEPAWLTSFLVKKSHKNRFSTTFFFYLSVRHTTNTGQVGGGWCRSGEGARQGEPCCHVSTFKPTAATHPYVMLLHSTPTPTGLLFRSNCEQQSLNRVRHTA